ncbi:14632_t:CDS:2, partial [Gigaspora margarita]
MYLYSILVVGLLRIKLKILNFTEEITQKWIERGFNKDILRSSDHENSEQLREEYENFLEELTSDSKLTRKQKSLIEKFLPSEELREQFKQYGLCFECHQPNTGTSFGGTNWCQSFRENAVNEMNVALKVLNNSQDVTTDFLREVTSYKLFDNMNLDKFNSLHITKCHGISRDPATENYIMVIDYMKDEKIENIELSGLLSRLYQQLKGETREINADEKLREIKHELFLEFCRQQYKHNRYASLERKVQKEFSELLYPPINNQPNSNFIYTKLRVKTIEEEINLLKKSRKNDAEAELIDNFIRARKKMTQDKNDKQ